MAAVKSRPLLIELGTEELPVKALPALADAFLLGLRLGLEKRGISLDKANGRVYYTPRRLAVQFSTSFAAPASGWQSRPTNSPGCVRRPATTK
jgi:glycyl-tRNA synthetase beta subunit